MSADSRVVGVFRDEALAENAIDVLRSAGFSYEQISYALRKDSCELHCLRDNLLKIGISDEEASYYASEFEAGSSIVLIRHDGRLGEALNILILNGTRKHRYLNARNNADRHVSNAPASVKNALNNLVEASQDSSSHNAPTGSAAHNSEVTVRDEMASLHKLLKDVGLDYLL